MLVYGSRFSPRVNRWLAAAVVCFFLLTIGWIVMQARAANAVAEQSAEHSFVQAVLKYRANREATHRVADASERSDTLQINVLWSLNEVTTAAMRLESPLRQLAIEWTKLEGEAVLSDSRHWEAVAEAFYAIDDGDKKEEAASYARAEKWEIKMDDAQRAADHVWSQILGLISASSRKRLA